MKQVEKSGADQSVTGLFAGKEFLCTSSNTMARHSETEEEMVVYRPLYGEGGLWVRPAAMWAEVVERDGRRQPRFAYIGE